MTFDFENPPPVDEPEENVSRERSSRAFPSRGRAATGDGADKPTNAAATRTAASAARLEEDLAKRLEETLSRIATALRDRDGWRELSSALREDGQRMSVATVNFTRKVKFLRGPLLWFLSIVEPVIAFGRVVRILFGKLMGWREGRQTEEEPEPER